MRPPKWAFFILALVAFELIADVLAKQFALSGKWVFAVTAILGFILANVAWLVSLRLGIELSKGAILFSVLSAIGAVAIGLIIYQEKVSRFQFLGLLLGVIAIALLTVG
jgi:multidrug transporter EmrE-like cation transporter